MTSQTVVIIDDQEIMVATLESWLSRCPGFKVVGTANSGCAGVELCRRCQPDIVLLDIEMPGMDGFAVARQLGRDVGRARIVFLTSHLSPYCIYETSRIGAYAYVNKTASLRVLEEALRQVTKGERYYAPLYHTLRQKQLSEPDAYQKILTPKEVAVLMLLTQGLDDRIIGEQLGIAASTVATHRRNMRAKLNTHCDRGLIRYARRWGVLPLDDDQVGTECHAHR